MKTMILAAVAVLGLGAGMVVTRMARPVSPVVCGVHLAPPPAVLVRVGPGGGVWHRQAMRQADIRPGGFIPALAA
ncbi:MAG TPA: hypothetical protein VFG12_01050 [Rhodopila sp.]|jgi:hypothetical protein|nr:hypothetical protein [Rhodopila sp.]